MYIEPRKNIIPSDCSSCQNTMCLGRSRAFRLGHSVRGSDGSGGVYFLPSDHGYYNNNLYIYIYMIMYVYIYICTYLYMYI